MTDEILASSARSPPMRAAIASVRTATKKRDNGTTREFNCVFMELAIDNPIDLHDGSFPRGGVGYESGHSFKTLVQGFSPSVEHDRGFIRDDIIDPAPADGRKPVTGEVHCVLRGVGASRAFRRIVMKRIGMTGIDEPVALAATALQQPV